MMKAQLRDIIDTTIRNHPKDCVFTDNAVDGAVSYIETKGSINLMNSNQFVDLIVEAIQSQEIYCPHEGIDKR